MRTPNFAASARRIKKKRTFQPKPQIGGEKPAALIKATADAAAAAKARDKETQARANRRAALIRRQLVSRSVIDGELDSVRPTVPFPIWLLDATVHGELTAKDTAALDLLLSVAREEPSHVERRLPLAALADALQLSRRDLLDGVIDRLAATRVSFDVRHHGLHASTDHLHFVNITRITKDNGERGISFSFPPQVLTLLHAGLPYVHLELLALILFRSRWSARLYKLVLRRVHDADIGSAGGTVAFSTTPAELAEALGWTSSPFHLNDFRKSVLGPAVKDLRRHLMRLAVLMDVRRGPGRGRPVEALDFTVHVHPAKAAAVRTPRIEDGSMVQLLGGRKGVREEAPALFVPPRIWLKAATLIDDTTWIEWNGGRAIDVSERAEAMAQAWDVALHRAYEGTGDQGLLAGIEARGPQAVAWEFAQDQAIDPDIVRPIVDRTEPQFPYGRRGLETPEHLIAQLARTARYDARGPRSEQPAEPTDPDERVVVSKVRTTEETDTPGEVTIVLAADARWNELNEPLRPHRAKRHDDGAVKMNRAIRAPDRYIVEATSYFLRPDSLDSVAAIEGIEEILDCGVAEAGSRLAPRAAAAPLPDSSKITLVIADHEAVWGLRDLLGPFRSGPREFGQDLAVAFRKDGEWQAVNQNMRIAPCQEAEIAKLPGVLQVLPHGASAARTVLTKRDAATAA